MTKIISVIIAICFWWQSYSQSGSNDSKTVLFSMPDDTAKIKLLYNFSAAFPYSNPDSASVYADSIVKISSRLGYPFGIGLGYVLNAEATYYKGEYMQSLIYYTRITELPGFVKGWVTNNNLGIGRVLVEFGDYSTGVALARKGWQDVNELGDSAYDRKLDQMKHTAHSKMMTSYIYSKILLMAGMLDSALLYAMKAYKADLRIRPGRWSAHNVLLGSIYAQKGDYPVALKYYNLPADINVAIDSADIFLGKAEVFQKLGNRDSCLIFANQGLLISQRAPFPRQMMKASALLSMLYEYSDPKESIRFFKLSLSLKESINSRQKSDQLASYKLAEQLKNFEIDTAISETRNRFRVWAMLGAIAALLGVAAILWRNNIHRKHSNTLLLGEKRKVDEALAELKTTQAQLIQSEKMASLGELTAGIAHEIQNPLNFINNFSEVNAELIDELDKELKSGNQQEAMAIAADIKSNELKIGLHGKRADAIVKGMMQHSRYDSGEKTPTDINTLAEEYLRLGYHSFRGREQHDITDNSFTVDLKTHFDPGVGKVDLIPQDFGRVLLNLYNNAFYAVREKAKNSDTSYKPTVELITGRENGFVRLTVRDNGNGIPDKIINKIFQPFFTTKPTGEGTGLGLSLSYDIIKSNGGNISVKSVEGEGSEFIVEFKY